eukprot:359971-Chlamydomonas_euryale.AAC.11
MQQRCTTPVNLRGKVDCTLTCVMPESPAKGIQALSCMRLSHKSGDGLHSTLFEWSTTERVRRTSYRSDQHCHADVYGSCHHSGAWCPLRGQTPTLCAPTYVSSAPVLAAVH